MKDDSLFYLISKQKVVVVYFRFPLNGNKNSFQNFQNSFHFELAKQSLTFLLA